MSYYGPSIGDSIIAGIIAFGIFCLGVGALLMWVIPKIWEWVKPMVHAVTA